MAIAREHGAAGSSTTGSRMITISSAPLNKAPEPPIAATTHAESATGRGDGRQTARPYQSVYPPSTTRISPVTKLATSSLSIRAGNWSQGLGEALSS